MDGSGSTRNPAKATTAPHAHVTTPGRRIHLHRPAIAAVWGRRIGVVVAALGVLLGQLLAGCGFTQTVGIDSAEGAVAALPDVVGADFTFHPGGLDNGPSLTGYIVVRPTTSSDGVAAVMGEAVDQVNAAGIPGLSGTLQLHFGDLPHQAGDPLPEEYLTVDIGPPVAGELVVAETRHWMALRETLSGACMWLEAPAQWQDGPGLARSVRVTVPNVDLPAELTAAFATFEQVERPPAAGSELLVAVPDPEAAYSHPIAFSSAFDVPPPEVRDAMRALAELAPAEPRFGSGVKADWIYGGPDVRPYLEVELHIDSEELLHVPGNQVNDRIPGSATERVALEHRAILDAAGVPYRLRAAAFTIEPFLEVDRRLSR